jgi:hypothetical protein
VVQQLAFPLHQMPGVEPQQPFPLALKLVFAALQLELDHIVNMAFELADALPGHGPIGK